MESLLVDKGDLYTLVDGTETAPLTGPNSKATIAFKKKQRLARATIRLNVEPNQLVHCKSEDPKEVWDGLAAAHNAQGLASLMSLRRTFHTMSKETDVSMRTWISSVRDIASRITELGSDVATEDIILALTRGLPPTYESLVIALDSMDRTNLTIDYVVQRLLNEEERQVSNANVADGTIGALIARARNTSTPRESSTSVCYNCECTGHLKNNCPISTREANAMRKKKEEGAANITETAHLASEGAQEYLEIF
jgi:hypothetical protein